MHPLWKFTSWPKQNALRRVEVDLGNWGAHSDTTLIVETNMWDQVPKRAMHGLIYPVLMPTLLDSITENHKIFWCAITFHDKHVIQQALKQVGWDMQHLQIDPETKDFELNALDENANAQDIPQAKIEGMLERDEIDVAKARDMLAQANGGKSVEEVLGKNNGNVDANAVPDAAEDGADPHPSLDTHMKHCQREQINPENLWDNASGNEFIPEWMKEHFDWHQKVRPMVDAETWPTFWHLVLTHASRVKSVAMSLIDCDKCQVCCDVLMKVIVCY